MIPVDQFDFFASHMDEAEMIGVAKVDGLWRVVHSDDSLRFTELKVPGDYGTHNNSVIEILNSDESVDVLRYSRQKAVSYSDKLFIPCTSPRPDALYEWLSAS